jgi:hypothetical protein
MTEKDHIKISTGCATRSLVLIIINCAATIVALR